MFWNRDPQIIQDVDETVSSMEQIWRNLALQNLPSNRSSAVNGCHQNERLNSWEKHYNNTQLIQTIPVHQLTSWEVESWVFVMNKYIIMMFKLFELWTSGEKYAEIHYCWQVKSVLNKYAYRFDVGRKCCYGIMNGLSKNALMMDLFICLFVCLPTAFHFTRH